MFSLKLMVLLVLIVVAVDAQKKPRRMRRQKFAIEVLSKRNTTVTARFKQFRRAKVYFVSISIKNLMDVSSHYVVTLKKGEDMEDDGYYYIDAGNSLEPGQLYEIHVSKITKKHQHKSLGTADFFSDCDPYTYQCETGYGERCLSASELCNGYSECTDGSDEETNYDDTCAVSVPDRPTPPPPPADAPCILALTAAQARGETDLPVCDAEGNYDVMKCGSDTFSPFTCHCLHPTTGRSLYNIPGYDPFTNWSFYDDCVERRNTEEVDGSKSE